MLATLNECAGRIAKAVEGERGRGLSGLRETQYHLDIATDDAAREFLLAEGFRVVSEESGVNGSGPLTVVMDPIDGSTNCDRGVPFYATSLAVLNNGELVAGLVANLANGDVFEAERGRGATRNGRPIWVSGERDLGAALVCFSGWPHRHGRWGQLRVLGAASLECCLVGDGSLDLFLMAHRAALHPWDYLAGLLVVVEAGGCAVDLGGLDLVTDAIELRRPAFAASPELLEAATIFDGSS